MNTYLLDANIFIQSWMLEYNPQFCSAFWNNCLLRGAEKSLLGSIDRVKNEIQQPAELAKWVEDKLPANFFINTTGIESSDEYRKLMQWTKDESYTPEAVNAFSNPKIADAYLIVYAAQNNCKIITHEAIRRPSKKKKIQIPNAASALNVSVYSIYDFMKEHLEDNFYLK